MVQSTGVTFTYVKATEGTTWADPKYAANSQKAASAGLAVGSYHLFVPHDDPIKQAKHFLATASVKKGALPPALDIEPIGTKTGINDIPQRVQKWLDHVEKVTGCRPIIYSGNGNWHTYLSGHFDTYGVWLAQYSNHAHPNAASPDWLIWQHAEKGRVKGIRGTVDLNYYSSKAKEIETILCK